MGCCADGTCTNPTCALCVELPKRFPPIQPCVNHACRLVFGHRGDCKPREKHAPDERVLNPVRDGAPKLSAERKRAGVSIKRQRQGPMYVPSSRRV